MLELELSQLSIGANSRPDQFAMQRESINVPDSLNKRKDYAKVEEAISRSDSGNKPLQLQVFLKELLTSRKNRPMSKNYTQ